MAFSTFLKGLRTEKNMTQVQMSEALDISVNAVKLIENGSTKFPSDKVLNRLCLMLRQDPLDVITDILFCDEDYKNHPNRYLACRYQGYMYLQDWNVEKSPYVTGIKNMPSYTFDGILSKKRNPKNKVIATVVARHLPAIRKSHFADDLNEGLSKMFFGLTWIHVPLKGVHLLFDSRLESQRFIYNIVSDLKVANVNIQITVILFNPDKGKIEKSSMISLKKVPEEFTELHGLLK